MDLPPSGWYPDPYRVPGLLRWWDGSTWTHHTHPGGGTGEAESAEPAATVQRAAVSQAAVGPTAVQPGAESASVPSTTVQPAVQATTVSPTTVQPAVQATTVQPAAVQPAAVQPTLVQPGVAGLAGGPAGGPDPNGTQVLFLGKDAWGAPGTPDPGVQASHYGYYRAQRRRRMWLASGLAAGTVVALAVIALVVSRLGQSSATPVAAQSTVASAHPTAQASTPSSATPSPAPSVTPSNSVLADGQSGLSYTQLAAPWQPDCPSGLTNQAFTWTAGESAIAGQINGGQTTWYGAACSGPLPQQYGYNGVADLENTATNLVNTFNGAYYGALQHNFQQEVSQPVQVSGHAGWEIKFGMTYTNAQAQGATWSDEQGAVVVADLGPGLAPAVFYVSIPGNLGENNVDSLVSSLQLTAVPPGSDSPSGGSPSAPGDGGNGDGGNGN